jgi:hypothetical protein
VNIKKLIKPIYYLCAFSLSLLFSGCVSNTLRQYNQKFLNDAYGLSGLSSQGRIAIEGYCKTNGDVTWEDSYRCQAAVSMAMAASNAVKNLQTPNSDIASIGNAAVTASLQVGQGYAEVWQDAIKYSAHDSVYDKSIHFGADDALRVASNIVSAMGVDRAIREADTSVLDLAKRYGTPEATAYAIAVHSVMDLGTSPRGSLVGYSQQLQAARTQWESAKTALSLHDLPATSSTHQ